MKGNRQVRALQARAHDAPAGRVDGGDLLRAREDAEEAGGGGETAGGGDGGGRRDGCSDHEDREEQGRNDLHGGTCGGLGLVREREVGGERKLRTKGVRGWVPVGRGGRRWRWVAETFSAVRGRRPPILLCLPADHLQRCEQGLVGGRRGEHGVEGGRLGCRDSRRCNAHGGATIVPADNRWRLGLGQRQPPTQAWHSLLELLLFLFRRGPPPYPILLSGLVGGVGAS